ncbi:MAG: hypothetical protein LBU36_01265 [Clostridiales bacterium]|nr:hypothetical protein [Clostridiales bacterium]
MAKEAIASIKAAEDEAAEIVRAAAEEGRKLSADTASAAAADVSAILRDAAKTKEDISGKARDAANKECAPIAEKGRQEAARILNPEEGKFRAAVELVVKRVLGSVGEAPPAPAPAERAPAPLTAPPAEEPKKAHSGEEQKEHVKTRKKTTTDEKSAEAETAPESGHKPARHRASAKKTAE